MSITLKLKPKVYSDAAYVEGVKNHDEHLTRELERYCRKYFDEHYRGVFFCGDEKRLEIFQDAFIVLWEKIENGNIYVEDGVLKGKNGKPFISSLTTYFMGIVKLKNLELAPNCNGTGTISQTILGLEGFINNINGPIQISRIRHKIFTMSTLV